MIYARTNRYGLHESIYKIQEALQSYLVWITGNSDVLGNVPTTQVASTAVEIYGKLETDSEKPVWYNGQNEYKEVFLNDNVSAQFGFVLRKVNDMTANIDLICSVKLDEVHGNSNRNEEKAKIEVKRALEYCGLIYTIQEVKEEISNCLNGFDIESYNEADLQPWYIFSFNLDINYYDDYC